MTWQLGDPPCPLYPPEPACFEVTLTAGGHTRVMAHRHTFGDSVSNTPLVYPVYTHFWLDLPTLWEPERSYSDCGSGKWRWARRPKQVAVFVIRTHEVHEVRVVPEGLDDTTGV